jgi:hypothetical protein
MERQCSDCKLPLEMIRILDATNPGAGGEGGTHVDLSYAPIGAEPGWFSGTKGVCPMTGMICPKCRRISLFG